MWDLFIQNPTSNNGGGSRSLSKAARSVLQDIHEINNWIEKLLDSPVPEEGRTRVELELFPKHIIPRQPLVFALPEKQSKHAHNEGGIAYAFAYSCFVDVI